MRSFSDVLGRHDIDIKQICRLSKLSSEIRKKFASVNICMSKEIEIASHSDCHELFNFYLGIFRLQLHKCRHTENFLIHFIESFIKTLTFFKNSPPKQISLQTFSPFHSSTTVSLNFICLSFFYVCINVWICFHSDHRFMFVLCVFVW